MNYLNGLQACTQIVRAHSLSGVACCPGNPGLSRCCLDCVAGWSIDILILASQSSDPNQSRATRGNQWERSFYICRGFGDFGRVDFVWKSRSKEKRAENPLQIRASCPNTICACFGGNSCPNPCCKLKNPWTAPTPVLSLLPYSGFVF